MKPLIVHGLRVDYEKPRLPPEEPGRIRAAVKNLEIAAAGPGYRASKKYRHDFNRCMGRVNKLARVGHSQHEPLLNRLRAILPLPNHKDITRAEKAISALESAAQKKETLSSYWFYKGVHRTAERLAILKRSFPIVAAELNARLQNLKVKISYA